VPFETFGKDESMLVARQVVSDLFWIMQLNAAGKLPNQKNINRSRKCLKDFFGVEL
jgi:hypothetical protein